MPARHTSRQVQAKEACLAARSGLSAGLVVTAAPWPIRIVDSMSRARATLAGPGRVPRWIRVGERRNVGGLTSSSFRCLPAGGQYLDDEHRQDEIPHTRVVSSGGWLGGLTQGNRPAWGQKMADTFLVHIRFSETVEGERRSFSHERAIIASDFHTACETALDEFKWL